MNAPIFKLDVSRGNNKRQVLEPLFCLVATTWKEVSSQGVFPRSRTGETSVSAPGFSRVLDDGADLRPAAVSERMVATMTGSWTVHVAEG
jgi:hypothetical protein